jgi:hypothetical protein
MYNTTQNRIVSRKSIDLTLICTNPSIPIHNRLLTIIDAWGSKDGWCLLSSTSICNMLGVLSPNGQPDYHNLRIYRSRLQAQGLIETKKIYSTTTLKPTTICRAIRAIPTEAQLEAIQKALGPYQTLRIGGVVSKATYPEIYTSGPVMGLVFGYPEFRHLLDPTSSEADAFWGKFMSSVRKGKFIKLGASPEVEVAQNSIYCICQAIGNIIKKKEKDKDRNPIIRSDKNAESLFLYLLKGHVGNPKSTYTGILCGLDDPKDFMARAKEAGRKTVLETMSI